MARYLVLLLVLLCVQVCYVSAWIDGLYCGQEDCYSVLGITRDATKSELSKAYRQLARKFHPDMHRTDKAKSEAEEKFKEIATAYEILKDEESRTDYDYMLDNPDEFYSHYYRYYRRRMAPRVDVRVVIAVTLTVISAVQYYTAWTRYDSAIRYLVTVPKYRLKAMEIAKEDGLFDNSKKNRRRSKEEVKEEEEAIIKKIVEEKMDIRGGYAKPQISDILWIQLILLPYTSIKYVVWYATWVWKFDVKREPYGDKEKLYLICKYMNLSEKQFEALDEEKKTGFLEAELWKKDKYEAWRAEKEEETKRQYAENPKYKAHRRYMKNHGAGRITLDCS